MSTYQREEFSTILKVLRKLRGITQQKMAKELNTSRSCISNYESGNRQPDSETIKLIADFFDVSVDYLLGRSPVKTTIKNNKDFQEIQDVMCKFSNIKELDMSNATANTRCATVEFYVYLLQKEKTKNNNNLAQARY